MGCFHIRHEFSDGAPALEDLCAELERRTGLRLEIKIDRLEVKPDKTASDGPSIPSPWPIYTEIAYVRVRGSTADVELHRAENTIGVEYLFGGVWLRRYLEAVTLDVVRRAGGRTKDGNHEEPPAWVTLPWRQVPKAKLWFQAALQRALVLGSYLVLPIVLPVLTVMAVFRGRGPGRSGRGPG